MTMAQSSFDFTKTLSGDTDLPVRKSFKQAEIMKTLTKDRDRKEQNSKCCITF